MKSRIVLPLIISLFSICAVWGAGDRTAEIKAILGVDEYAALMQLSLDEFDQTPAGFRQYTGNYELVRLVIPEYIAVNELDDRQSRNLHWHLGQIHAFNKHPKEAIAEMKQSYEGGSVTWASYVKGSIAFLEKDMESLKAALATLEAQENQMNIQFLRKFIVHFNKSYSEAYNVE